MRTLRSHGGVAVTGPGPVLGTLRRKTGLTVRQVAKRARVGRGYLVRVERGQVAPPEAWLAHVADTLAAALTEDRAVKR